MRLGSRVWLEVMFRFLNRKGKLGANAMKRVAAGAHLPTLNFSIGRGRSSPDTQFHNRCKHYSMNLCCSMLKMSEVHFLTFIRFHIGYSTVLFDVTVARVHFEHTYCGPGVQKTCSYLLQGLLRYWKSVFIQEMYENSLRNFWSNVHSDSRIDPVSIHLITSIPSVSSDLT